MFQRLLAAWSFLDFCLLAAGIVSLVLSLVWRTPNLVLNLIISTADTTAGIALGSTYLATAAFSIIAIIQPNYSTFLLYGLNWLLLACGIETVCVGTFIWYYTLTERSDFDGLWLQQGNANLVQMQNYFQCCGYFNGTDHAAIQAGSFCPTTAIAANSTGCVTPVTGAADVMLNNIFTTIYGFMFIIILFFLATVCVINKRMELERFKKIDEKRGGKGFV